MAALDSFRQSVAIIVSSCDAFFDAWRPFDSFLKLFWPDCPFEIFLITNELQIRSSHIFALPVGPDRGWSDNLLQALDHIQHPYVFYMQEDYFLTEPLRDEQLANDFTEMIESGAASLCFRARSNADSGFEPLNERFGIVPIHSDGRTRCQVTLWNRKALRSILRPGETAWNFEARGSERTQEMRMLSYRRRDNTPIPYLMSAISRGFWMPDALTLCRLHGVNIEPLLRPVYSSSSWKRRMQRAFSQRRFERAFRTAKETGIDLE